MADVGPSSLTAFEATLRCRTAMRWQGEQLDPEATVELVPAATDLLVLSHRPSSRFLRSQPVHATLMLELATSLDEAVPGPLPFARAMFRAGTDRLAYQCTHVLGSLTLVETSGGHVVLEGSLSLVDPELDVEGAGGRLLTGTMHVATRG
jgi:hypothetical protein